MFRPFWNILRRLADSYLLSTYNDFTIAEHFRRQGARVGNDCRILVRSLGSEPFLVRIGHHCTIAPNVAFVTHDGGAWVFTEELPSLQKFGPIEIRDNCFVGVAAILLPNVRIGPNAIVAAGAVVTKDVPPGSVVGGCPAKTICSLDDYKRRVQRTWATQRPHGYMSDLQDGVRYAPTVIQMHKHRDWDLLRNHLSELFWTD